MTHPITGYIKALETILKKTQPMGTQSLPLQDCIGHVAAEDVFAKVDAPSADASLMDGYAFNTSDIAGNRTAGPVRLTLVGNSAAGQKKIDSVEPGTAMRILTGGRIPPGADTVAAEEDVRIDGAFIEMAAPVKTGENILARGSDIKAKDPVVRQGEHFTPGNIGLLATAGCNKAPAYRKPSVALIATGDEIRLPGQSLTPGTLYASNIITADSWCRCYGITTSLHVSKDDPKELEACLRSALETHDAVITSGGAWTGDRDLTVKILDQLAWEKHFHRIRLGPGKAAGFGLWNQNPVFILPGGPPSSIAAFLTLALPGLMNMCGMKNPGLPKIPATLTKAVKSQADWTHAEYGTLETSSSGILFCPIGKKESRLKSIATAQGLLLVPEGTTTLNKNEPVWVYDLRK